MNEICSPEIIYFDEKLYSYFINMDYTFLLHIFLFPLLVTFIYVLLQNSKRRHYFIYCKCSAYCANNFQAITSTLFI